MGSFNSSPRVPEIEDPDADMDFSNIKSQKDLLELCSDQLAHLPTPFERNWRYPSGDSRKQGIGHFRVMQWNVLSQAIGVNLDKFAACPVDALSWSTRRFRMLEEMIMYLPDIICLQEVDHFNFLDKALTPLGYKGIFLPKPDSPCYYQEGNTGPDGCAIFYNTEKFELVKKQTRVVEVCSVQSNQVLIFLILREVQSKNEVCIATTHLKARSGALLALLRNEQGKDIMGFLSMHRAGRPVLVCGDFNADPNEPVYARMTSPHASLSLTSSYTLISDDLEEPQYTSWKIREDGEVCHTLDYMFHTTSSVQVEAVLDFPTEEQIGPTRIPSFQYASDHFSLCADYSFIEK
ncbi:Nocturnin [Nymphon striatum]|nr:Nocturnin [Nymphon striatum]